LFKDNTASADFPPKPPKAKARAARAERRKP
jgi:hypothetical protein